MACGCGSLLRTRRKRKIRSAWHNDCSQEPKLLLKEAFMSVTIVSALPKQAPSSAADSAPAAADVDAGAFASLLLGQAQPLIAPVLQEIKPDAEKSEDPATPSDAAALLAVISAALPAPPAPAEASGAKTDAPAIGALGKSASDPTPAAAAELALARGQDLPPTAASANNEPGPTPTRAAADQPAIIAASAEILPQTKAELAPAAPADSVASAASAAAALAAAGAKAPAVQRESATSVATPIRDHAWAGDFAQKVVWLATSDRQAAQLTLNPAQMGPIEISMSVNKGHATASFFSANAEVRDAIETAMPRLREMFANAGISLGQTNVSAESFRQAGNDYARNGGSRLHNDNAILAADSGASLSGRQLSALRGNSLVDIFA